MSRLYTDFKHDGGDEYKQHARCTEIPEIRCDVQCNE